MDPTMMQDPATQVPPTKQVLPQETDTMEDDSDQIAQMLTDHMNSLPKEQQAALAPYMTKDLAVILGLVTGSREVYEYFDKVADPSMVLVPTPVDKAGASAPTPTDAGAPPAAAPIPTPVQGPMVQ